MVSYFVLGLDVRRELFVDWVQILPPVPILFRLVPDIGPQWIPIEIVQVNNPIIRIKANPRQNNENRMSTIIPTIEPVFDNPLDICQSDFPL